MSASPAPETSLSPSGASLSRDRWLGLGLIGVSFIVALAFSWHAKELAMPRVATPPAEPTSAGIDGFPSAVAALGVLPRARLLTERDQLVGIAFTGVKSDGAVDLGQQGRGRFVFRSLEGKGPEPEREYGTLPARKYCGFQVITLTDVGLGAQPDVSDVDCRRAIEPLPEPKCTHAAIWSVAKQKGARETEPALIEYYRSVGGPAWYFQSGAVDLFLAEDCTTELGADQARSVSGKRVPG